MKTLLRLILVSLVLGGTSFAFGQTNDDKGIVVGSNRLLRTGLGADLTPSSSTITITDRVHYLVGTGTLNRITVSGGNPSGTTDVYLIRKAGSTVTFSTAGGNITGVAPTVQDNVPIYGVWDGTNWRLSSANPTFDASAVTTGVLAVARGGTGVATSTGSGSVVLAGSPALTGTPTAPTAAVDTNSTQIATTAFVATATASLPANNQTVGGTWTFTPGVRERGRSTYLGEWTTFTPTVTPTSGTWTSPTYTTAQYTLIGKTMLLLIQMTGTTSAGAALQVGVPGGFTSVRGLYYRGIRVAAGVDSNITIQSVASGGNLILYSDANGASIPASTSTYHISIQLEVQ